MSFAQFVGDGSNGLVGAINTVVVPIILTLAFLVFVWGVINYFLINGGDEGKRAEGRQFVLWGVLGLTLLFSVWGVVNIALSTFGISPR